MKSGKTKIVVVGGGFGGVKTALNLANKPGFEVQLISNSTHFEYHGALYRSAVGHSPMEVVIPLREIFKDIKNVEVILDGVCVIDDKKKRLASETGNIYSYDKVVFALGNSVNYFGITGLAQNTESINEISSTIRLRKKMVDLFSNPTNKPIKIAVVGAGASGTELAGEISDFAKFVAKSRGIKTPKVKVSLIDGADRVLPLLSQKASVKAAKRLKDIGVDIYLNIKVNSCSPTKLCTATGDISADLIIWTAGSKPSEVYGANPTVFTLGRGGRVVVDEYLKAQNQKSIYVIGDNADTKYSGMAQTALNDANFVSKNFLLEKTKSKPKKYRPKKPIYVVTVGKNWAVVQKGSKVISGKAGWTIRRRADLAIFRNFQPYKLAIKTWRQAHKMAKI